MHPDHVPYLKFTTRSRLIKSIESVAGLVEGIDIDRKINSTELRFLEEWLEAHNDIQHRHPFNEIIPIVRDAIQDGKLTEDEKENIKWLCERIVNDTTYTDYVTSDLRRLHGILGGIAADGKILKQELNGLTNWLAEHEHLKTCWPYDEIDSIVTSVLSDQKIDRNEHGLLLQYFSEFTNTGNNTVVSLPISIQGTLTGLCAITPNIEFKDKVFCLTGASHKYKRSDFIKLISELGGEYSNSMNNHVNYLIVGADGNPCWQYACYGRKVEAAVQLRKSGWNILIVHENDFHDSVSDYTGR